MVTSTRSRSKPGSTSSTDGAPRLQAGSTVVADARPRPSSIEADIAHDLNNLMTTVAGFTEMAMDSLGGDHPVAADLQQVADAAEQAGVLTRRLLALHHAPTDPSEDTERAAAPMLSPASIVLADDDPGIRRFARRALEEAGHHVVEAIDGAAALELASRLGAVDLLVTDLDMPRLNGLDLADALRVRHPSVAVLYVSGGDRKRLAGRLDAPGVAWLEKPFSGAALVAVVEAMLRAIGQATPTASTAPES